MSGSGHAETYFAAAASLARAVDPERVDAMARGLAELRDRGGRLFILGVGGGAGHASHAVNDFRKLCAIESYAATDNVSELTARINDDGWETSFVGWLEVSRLSERDALLVFSVGGGSREHGVSVNLVNALERGQRARAAPSMAWSASPGGTLPARRCRDPDRPAVRTCVRRWSSRSRRLCGTRSSPTPTSRRGAGHWESIAAQ